VNPNTRSIIVASAFALTSAASSLAHGATVTSLSGYEVFKGVQLGSFTAGVSFAGWTTTISGAWSPVPSNNGGAWFISANFVGNPGIVSGTANSVTAVGGRWFLEGTDGTRQAGILLRGTVTWPASLDLNIGCGPGIAILGATISRDGFRPAGEIRGCIDDTHLDQVYPPKVWGSFQLN
jgi:hypothetical protein